VFEEEKRKEAESNKKIEEAYQNNVVENTRAFYKAFGAEELAPKSYAEFKAITKDKSESGFHLNDAGPNVGNTIKSGNTFQYEPSAKANRMEKSHQKTQKKASRAKNKTQKTVYRMERVLDEKTGKYTFKAVAHRVDKDYGAKRKGRLASKGKELAKKGYHISKDILKENMNEDDGQMKYAEGVANGARTGFHYGKGVKNFVDKQKQNEAMRLEKKAKHQGYQLEAQKNAEKEKAAKKAAADRARREQQRESIKNKYKRQAVQQHAQQQSSLASFFSTKESRKKVLEDAKKTVSKYLLAVGAIIILFGSLLGGCSAVFQAIFGGSNMILQGAYAAPPEELEQAENYFNQFEMLLVEEMTTFYDDLASVLDRNDGTVDGIYHNADGTEIHLVVNYDLEAVRHNPNVLMNYLTTRYGEFDFTENDLTTAVPTEIRNLFTACYGVEISLLGVDEHMDFACSSLYPICSNGYVDRSEQVPDASGNMVTHEWKDYIWTVGGAGDFVSLETVVSNNLSGLNATYQDRYELLTETNGLLQVATGIMEEDWYSDVIANYGNGYGGIDYSYDGWHPFNGNTDSWGEIFRNYTAVDCSGGRTLYAGLIGTVTSVTTDSVTIEAEGSGLISYKRITFSGLSSINVTVNQAVTDETVIGTCNNILYLYYNRDGTYYNPTFYIR